MELKSYSSGVALVVELSGRFDAYEVPAFVAWLQKALQTGGAHIVVNLSGVNFLDSVALATLVQGMKRCREREGDLRLCCLQQSARVIFELTRLDKAFAIFENLDLAVQSFTGSP